MTTFHEGARVVTRRGKCGVVVSESGHVCAVRFGGRVFDMKVTQLVHEHAYDRMMRGKPVQR